VKSNNILSGITEVEIGISGRCNSGCIDCERFYIKDKKDIFINSRNKTLNKIIDVDLVSKSLIKCKKLKNLYIIGTTGDPLTHPDLVKFVGKIYSALPSVNIIIHTNGSLGSEQIWQTLALFSDRTEVVFSIDGLEDTNHIYRRNVKWESIMKNAKTFIDAGGKATWKWVIFPHNKHQLLEARHTSYKMGFNKFVAEDRYTPLDWFDDLIVDQSSLPIPTQGYLPSLTAQMVEQEKQSYDQMFKKFIEMGGTINPWCTSDNSKLEKFYIDADGTVWPCCYFAVLEYYCDQNVWASWLLKKKQIINRHGEKFNNIYFRDLEKILTCEIFPPRVSQNFDNLDSAESSDIMKPCIINCGKCLDVETRGRLSDHSLEFFKYRN